jgi:GNAT superfamily N-acetyltransferase
MKIDYSLKENSLNVDDFIRLKEEAFGAKCPRDVSITSLEGSRYVLHVELDGEVIGMCRIIGDGGFVNFIADMIVVPEFQGKGIGRMIMERTIKFVEDNIPNGGRTTITLNATKGKEGFYEKFGFNVCPDERFGAGMQKWLKK